MRQIDGDVLLEQMKHRKEYVGRLSDPVCLVEDAPTVCVWISVKDRLPEEPGRYLCWFGKNTFAVGASIVPYIPDLHWFASRESLERYENVTHWMPIPEPPKEGTP